MNTHEYSVHHSRGARWWAVVVCCAGLGLIPKAEAGQILPNGAVGLKAVASGVEYIEPANLFSSPGTVFQGRTFADPVARSMSLVETYGLELGGNNITVQAARAVTAAELGLGLATGAIAIAGAAQAGWAIGTAIANALDLGSPNAGARMFPGTDGQWHSDDGVIPGKQLTKCYRVMNYEQLGCAPSPQGAMALFAPAGKPSPTGVIGTGQYECTDAGSDYFYCSYYGASSYYPDDKSWYKGFTITPGSPTMADKPCDSYIDFSNSGYSNLSPSIGADGKCPTGRYTTAYSPASAATVIAERLPEAKMKPAAEYLLANGKAIPAADARKLSGPSTVQGQETSSRTTSEQGSTTTSSKPTTNYTYNNSSVTYNTTVNNTTTTTDASGKTTTTTTTSTTPGTTPTGLAAAEPAKNSCETNPTSVGCLELGEAPSDEVPKTTKTLTYTAEDLGLPSGCPADFTVDLGTSGTQTISYDRTCDVATKARPFIIAVAALGALTMVVAALRGM